MRIRYNKNDLGLSFATVTLAMIVYALIASIIAQTCNLEGKYWWTIVQYTLNTLVIGGSAFVYAAITNTNVVQATAINKKPPLAHIGWGVLATVFLITMMVPLNNWLMQLIVKMGLKEPS